MTLGRRRTLARKNLVDRVRTTRSRAVLALIATVVGFVPSPVLAQSGERTPVGQWWLHAGFGAGRAGAEYGEFLGDALYGDLSIAKGLGHWRYGGGLQFGSLKMGSPYEDELEWARAEVFGSVMRVFNAESSVRPFVEVRPAIVRMHSRSMVFDLLTPEEFEEGHNPGQVATGIGVTLRPGIEIDLKEGFALDLSGSWSAYTTSEYDLAPIGMTEASSGIEWGVRVGFTWRPIGAGVRGAPTGGASRLAPPGAHGDAWGIPKSWGWAIAEMLGINFGAAMANDFAGRGVGQWPVTPDSWRFNLERGWRFDDNGFKTNQLIHPFNGGTYFNSARSNGIGFWGSSGMALVGAFVWEAFGETHPMSWNDMISTGLGGISRGEVMYRASSLILDNTLSGSSRIWRELAAFPINPVRTFNRVLSGRAGEVRGNPANPYDRRPPVLLTQLNFGARMIGEGESISENTNYYGFVDLALLYGSPFENERRSPFDRFDAYVQLNLGDKTAVGRLQIRGDLWSWPLGGESGSDTRHALAISHDFDYIDNEAYEYGGQGFGLALFSRFGSPETQLTTRLTATVIAGAAVNADYSFLASIPDPREVRDYDYGPGVGAGFEALLSRSGRTVARLNYRYTMIDVNNGSLFNPEDDGSDARHQVHRLNIQIVIPVNDRLGIGFDGGLFFRNSKYDAPDLVDRTQRIPELRVYLARSWQ